MKTSTRKARQTVAKLRRLHQIEKLLGELRGHLANGKTYTEACETMATETELAINQNPQEKDEIVATWRELFARIHKVTRELQQKIASGEHDTSDKTDKT